MGNAPVSAERAASCLLSSGSKYTVCRILSLLGGLRFLAIVVDHYTYTNATHQTNSTISRNGGMGDHPVWHEVFKSRFPS